MKNFIFIFLSLIFFSSFLFSHGVECDIIEGGVGVEVRYEDVDKTPISYAEVKVYAPDGKEFQQGLTDKFGRFLFYPDKKGVWKVEVNDGMGHGVVKEISVSEEKKVIKESTKKFKFSLLQQFVVGLSIIWGITGLVFYILSKKHLKTHNYITNNS